MTSTSTSMTPDQLGWGRGRGWVGCAVLDCGYGCGWCCCCLTPSDTGPGSFYDADAGFAGLEVAAGLGYGLVGPWGLTVAWRSARHVGGGHGHDYRDRWRPAEDRAQRLSATNAL